jgi:hypothetical protein
MINLSKSTYGFIPSYNGSQFNNNNLFLKLNIFNFWSLTE